MVILLFLIRGGGKHYSPSLGKVVHSFEPRLFLSPADRHFLYSGFISNFLALEFTKVAEDEIRLPGIRVRPIVSDGFRI